MRIDFCEYSIPLRSFTVTLALQVFGKYFFDPVTEDFGEKTLYIDEPSMAPEGSNLIETIYLPNGKPALVLYEK